MEKEKEKEKANENKREIRKKKKEESDFLGEMADSWTRSGNNEVETSWITETTKSTKKKKIPSWWGMLMRHENQLKELPMSRARIIWTNIMYKIGQNYNPKNKISMIPSWYK